jgi:hypothetical protein
VIAGNKVVATIPWNQPRGLAVSKDERAYVAARIAPLP